MTVIKTKKYIIEAFILATIITSGFLIAQTFLTSDVINWWEAASVYFSFACTWLCTRQVQFNYVLGVISTSLLAYVFFSAELYGSMALNLYLIPTVIYGFFVWGKDKNTKPVEHVKFKAAGLYIFFTAITWFGAYQLITFFGGTMGGLDSWLLIGSILAQYLLDRKKIETWIIWALVNIVSIYVYFESGLYLLAGQFLFFLINTIIAYIQWKKTMKKSANSKEITVNSTPVGIAATI